MSDYSVSKAQSGVYGIALANNVAKTIDLDGFVTAIYVDTDGAFPVWVTVDGTTPVKASAGGSTAALKIRNAAGTAKVAVPIKAGVGVTTISLLADGGTVTVDVHR